MTVPSGQRQGYRPGSLELLAIGLVLLIVGQRWLVGLFDDPAVQTGATIFVSIVVQALPFLVLGVVLSGAIAAFVPASFWKKALPKNPALAVPVAGAAGAVLPGCECASVPVANGLMSRGVAPAAALAFLLSAPAINPIVLASTFVAFPGEPMMVVARFVASLATAVIMGWLWLRFGKAKWLRIGPRDHLVGASPWHTFRLTATHDFLHAGGFLVIGGLFAAALNVVVPQQWLAAVADQPILSVLVLALLAVLLSICSEADAFVAASLTEFSLTAKLAFLVVGPMVDLKLISLQAGTFSGKFATRFAPTTFVVAVIFSLLVGWWLLT
ncbi:MAG: permease [Actinobacteria bacterium]|nr:permease [Actinomycetota bacterium]